MTLGGQCPKHRNQGRWALNPVRRHRGVRSPSAEVGAPPFSPDRPWEQASLAARSWASKAPGAAPETPRGFLGSATTLATRSAQDAECSLGSDFPVASPQPKADPQQTGTAPPSTTIWTKAPHVGPGEPAPGVELAQKARCQRGPGGLWLHPLRLLPQGASGRQTPRTVIEDEDRGRVPGAGRTTEDRVQSGGHRLSDLREHRMQSRCQAPLPRPTPAGTGGGRTDPAPAGPVPGTTVRGVGLPRPPAHSKCAMNAPGLSRHLSSQEAFARSRKAVWKRKKSGLRGGTGGIVSPKFTSTQTLCRGPCLEGRSLQTEWGEGLVDWGGPCPGDGALARGERGRDAAERRVWGPRGDGGRGWGDAAGAQEAPRWGPPEGSSLPPPCFPSSGPPTAWE